MFISPLKVTKHIILTTLKFMKNEKTFKIITSGIIRVLFSI